MASVSVYLPVLTVVSRDDVKGEEEPQKKPLVLHSLTVSSGELGTVEELTRRRI